jgi:O-antigen ligase
MDGTILAFTYPLVIAMALSVDGKFTRALILTIPILAVFASTSSVGIGGICLSITLVLLKKRLNLKFLMIPVLLFLVAVLVIPHIFSDSLRFIMWKMAMSAWSQQSIVTQLFGTGLGTYSILGPMIQLQNHFTSNGFYIWMHNDWLQCMFELGYVGFTIILIYSILILRRAYKKSAYLFSSLATFFVVAGMNYPTKAIPSAIIMILLIKMALDAYDI